MNTAYARVANVGLYRHGATLGLLAAVVAVIAIEQSWPTYEPMHEGVEFAGLLVMLAAVAGRCWCALYLAGPPAGHVIESGPYSVTRNPMLLFTLLGAWGAGAQSGSIAVGVLSLATMWVAARLWVVREEDALLARHHGAYLRYRLRTPRFAPNWRLWRDDGSMAFDVGVMTRALLTGAVLFASIPIAEGLEALQRARLLPVLFDLP